MKSAFGPWRSSYLPLNFDRQTYGIEAVIIDRGSKPARSEAYDEDMRCIPWKWAS